MWPRFEYIVLKYQSYKYVTYMDVPKEINIHLMVELSSISNDSISPHTMVTITGENRLF